MRRDDVQHALDAMASEVTPPASGVDAVLARGRRRRVQRRVVLVGIAAALVAGVATAGALTHANDGGHVVSLHPTTTSAPSSSGVTKPTSAVTTLDPDAAPPAIPISIAVAAPNGCVALFGSRDVLA